MRVRRYFVWLSHFDSLFHFYVKKTPHVREGATNIHCFVYNVQINETLSARVKRRKPGVSIVWSLIRSVQRT